MSTCALHSISAAKSSGFKEAPPISPPSISGMACSAAAFLTFIFIKGDAEIVQKRSDGGFRQIKNATCEELSSPGTPLGVVTEYRFRLSETFTRDEHLAFYAVHQYAEVYIDEELVYSLKPSKNNPYVKTVGSN